jgi:hypothetical protein
MSNFDRDRAMSDRLRAIKDGSQAASTNILSTSDQSTVLIHHFPHDSGAKETPPQHSPALGAAQAIAHGEQDANGEVRTQQSTHDSSPGDSDQIPTQPNIEPLGIADDLDPLGMSEVKDLPANQQSLSMRARERRREQLELLMK